MIKLLYKPMSMLVSVLGGLLAGALFRRVWKITAREDSAPAAGEGHPLFPLPRCRRGWR
jgi:uncharacterized protein DUF4235